MIIQPVLCSFHQLFRNDPQGLTLQKVSFSTSHLGIKEKPATRRQRIYTRNLEYPFFLYLVVEAIFALKFPMFRANRKLVPMDT